MINIYPANKLENLALLLDRVMQNNINSNVLSEEIILVQSKGMQHWLNLKLAESRGISMNLNFCLPVQFFWNQIKTILGKDVVPEQSAYSRDVLSWRIHALLASDDVVNNPLCADATRYWLTDSNEDKRFQLACQLGDLFEQYLLFRPDWILEWDKGVPEKDPDKQWQASIWQLLIAQDPLHPVALLKQASASLKQKKALLPEHISLFGINTLPLLWLEFLSELGNTTQVHFFHLNPCVEYWGDLKTDKAIAKEQFYRWVNSTDTTDIEMLSPSDDESWLNQPPQINPLLSNLGTQGKDFLYLLQEHTSIEIPVYESPDEGISDTKKQASVLQKIQGDILNLRDKRTIPEKFVDDSLVIASAHSALREIQALHDWLLHQFNNDTTLTPKDIVVMCPNVEKYAPYVEAVFAHGWYDWSERVPPLPCSIADRTLKDSEPLVQAFINLLGLPDSRFQVSQVLDYLRLPALQHKFNFSEDDLLVLERWINHASIHWGLNATHKQKILSLEDSNEKFSWQQGLDRLLLGFAQGDQTSLYHDQLLLPDVEGNEALLLGRFFELLEQLKFHAQALLTPRTPNDWRLFLKQSKENLFSELPEDNAAHQIIDQAIDDLGEYTSHARYNEALPLAVIQEFLVSHFSQPEPGRQFMAGQVTFCSMLPMRSVPFRIIAILGLNDGEFPRQRQPMGFDLIAAEPARKGDRSLRGDDRYLFLEALISCRDKLYLSYQGHDIKTNNPREPSLVLQELIDYLEKAYGWQLTNDSKAQLFKVPLQAFSKDNYQGAFNSFNQHWLKLSQAGKPRNNLQSIDIQSNALTSETSPDLSLNAEELVRFFDNPCRQFAQRQLGLYLDQGQIVVPEDSEPFSTNHLDRYLIQDKIIHTLLDEDSNESDIDDLLRGLSLSGKLPDTPNIDDELQEWKEQAIEFAQHIQNLTASNKIQKQLVQVTIDNVLLEAELPQSGNDLLFWRLATPKGKDDIRLWIHHLIAQVAVESDTITRGIFRGKKDGAILAIEFKPIDAAQEKLTELLQCWKDGMQQPLLLNANLGQKACINDSLSDSQFYAFWQDDYQTSGLGSDPYVHWFWSSEDGAPPQWQNDWQACVESIYSPLYASRQELTS